MDCVVWVAEKAKACKRDSESEDDNDDDASSETGTGDKDSILEVEEEALRSFTLTSPTADEDTITPSTDEEEPQCTDERIHTSFDPLMTASLTANREVLEDKLKNHHRNIGNLGSKEALEERRRECVAQGLLQSRHQHLVRNVFEALPTAEEHGELSVSDRAGHEEDSTQDEASANKTSHAVVLQPPASGDQKFSDRGLDVVVKEDNDDDDIFITPVPSWQISHTTFEKTR